MAQNQHVAALDKTMTAAFQGSQSKSFGADSPQDFAALGGFNSSASIGTFLMTFFAYAASLAKQGIDTPEERQKIKDAVMLAFDTYLAPNLGPLVSRALRRSLDTIVTNALETFGT